MLFAATMNGVNPKMSDSDKKLVVDSIVNSCDEKDGLKDGMIFNPPLAITTLPFSPVAAPKPIVA